ncbi:MAG: ATP-binding protein [Hyphomicrobiaceae bacterium]|nr:ATP-binding protein [Hyphomicrobiaceae bacterium]
MRLDSLAFRLFAASAGWTLIVLPLAGLLIYEFYKADFQANFDVQLKKLVTSIAVDSILTEASRPLQPENRYEPLFEVTHSGWYWQIAPLDGAGGPVLRSASLATAELDSPYRLGYPEDPETNMRWRNDAGPDGQSLRIVELVQALGGATDAPRYSVMVAGPLDWFDEAVANFRLRLATALSLAGLGLVAMTLLQVRFGLRPLREVEKSLTAIRSGHADRLEGTVPAEIEPLRDELNALIGSNQDIIERARTQVGNLAHAMKTPLAVILNEATEQKSPAGAKIVEQAGIMRDQINHYLDRARIAARADVIGRVTPVRPVVDPLVRALERIHQDRDIHIAVQCAHALSFQGERQDLEEMLGNLVDNACKWARSTVRLTIVSQQPEQRTAARRLIVLVEDDGPGLSDEHISTIGKRGMRLDETKPGSGLGLSIVIDLAQSYRGSFALARSDLGGLQARLELPAA